MMQLLIIVTIAIWAIIATDAFTPSKPVKPLVDVYTAPSPSTESTPTTAPTKSTTTGTTTVTASLNGNNMLYFINDYRSKNGVAQLNQSNDICALAQARADFIIKEDPNGQKSAYGSHYMFREFIEARGITTALGENQYGTTSSNDVQVIEGWKRSPSHNALMLATSYQGDVYTKGCVRVSRNGPNNVVIFLIGS